MRVATTTRETLVQADCPICGADNRVAFAFERNGNTIYSCGRCSLEFAFPQPTDDTLSSIYSSAYFLGSRDEASVERQRALKRATAKLYLDSMAAFIRPRKPKLLEVGCGSGDFLIEAQSRGFEVEGLEYSEHAARSANERLGRSAVRVGSLEKGSLPSAAYDVIAAFDVIEHLRDPKQAAECLRDVLKSGGIVAIVTPSLDSWSRRALGRYWMEYKTEHLTYFSQRSLKQLLETTGFENVRFLPNYKTLSVDYIASHFERYPVPVLSPIMRLVRRALPAKLSHRPVRIAASGVMALARKSD